MSMFKRLLVVGALAGAAPVVGVTQFVQAAEPAASVKITDEQLGQMITAIGLTPDKKEQRFDFAFRAQMEDQQWELSMSAVLSNDKNSVWVMAWLDELPKASADVPRSALLRLLSQNDALGDGKFFAYIPANRRFVMQRTIPNDNLTSAQLRVILQDLGTSVVETYPVWSVTNWNGSGIPAAPTGQTTAPPVTSAPGAPPVSQTAANETEFAQPVRR